MLSRWTSSMLRWRPQSSVITMALQPSLAHLVARTTALAVWIRVVDLGRPPCLVLIVYGTYSPTSSPWE